jgi:hypothetical protein
MQQQAPPFVVPIHNNRAIRKLFPLRNQDVAFAEFHKSIMRDRSRIVNNLYHAFLSFLAHRAAAAFRALRVRCSAVSFRALALPPFNPPSRPNATAAAFFFSAIPTFSQKRRPGESLVLKNPTVRAGNPRTSHS